MDKVTIESNGTTSFVVVDGEKLLGVMPYVLADTEKALQLLEDLVEALNADSFNIEVERAERKILPFVRDYP